MSKITILIRKNPNNSGCSRDYNEKKWLNKNIPFLRKVASYIPEKYLEESIYHPNISIHNSTFVHKDATVKCHDGGTLNIGKKCTIHAGAMVITQHGDISIGNKISINPYCVIYGAGGLTIEDNVRIAAHVVIIPENHVFDGVNLEQGVKGKTRLGVKIEKGVWIGAGARILDGCCVAEGSVIGAGSVLTKSTEPGGVYVGSPAKLLRIRS